MDLSVLCNIPISLSFRPHASLHTGLLALHNSHKQPLSALKEIFCHTATHHTPKLSPPTTCSGSHSSLTSSTGTHPVTKICEFPYCIHFITLLFSLLHCLSNISVKLFLCNISLKLWSHPFHSSTSNVDPLATLYTQNLVRHYSLATEPTWVNITFRFAILYDAITDHYLGLPKVNFQTVALKRLLPF